MTDPSVFRLRVSAGSHAVVFGWDYPGSTLLRVRIQRSDEQFADASYQGVAPDKHSDGQRVVFDGVTGSFRDLDVTPGATYFYTVWARPVDAAHAGQAAPAEASAREEAGSPAADEGGWTFWARKQVCTGRVWGLCLRLALARLLGRG